MKATLDVIVEEHMDTSKVIKKAIDRYIKHQCLKADTESEESDCDFYQFLNDETTTGVINDVTTETNQNVYFERQSTVAPKDRKSTYRQSLHMDKNSAKNIEEQLNQEQHMQKEASINSAFEIESISSKDKNKHSIEQSFNNNDMEHKPHKHT